MVWALIKNIIKIYEIMQIFILLLVKILQRRKLEEKH